MERITPLRARVLHALAEAEKPEECSEPSVNENNMRLPLCRPPHRRGYMITVVLGLLLLVIFFLPLISKTTHKPLEWHVSPEHKKKVHEHAQSVLDSQCRPGSTRQRLLARLPASSHRTQPFLWKNMPLPDELFQYPPPFGFKGHQGRVEDLLKLLPNSDDTSQMKKTERCQRCMVVGNGGILRGLELGPLINHFDTIIRLNSGPLEGFSVDVGNRTSIRMSYPEGTPHPWVDRDPHTLFVGVTYKRVDINWMSAMISKNAVSLWDRLFFWKSIPDQVPVKPHRFRLLNPQVIEETAFYLLKYPAPTSRLWGSDQFSDRPSAASPLPFFHCVWCPLQSLTGSQGRKVCMQCVFLFNTCNKKMSML
uniref:lactosylceramide alpha-2,3-sialyltransferase isoform X3 n=1 Tax=Monopterus albus TaxID=43700 RepID=UPI0009B3D295|nr:lactosylceramide alpha-2,3-sialyltransferase isoform X3 [Monopterus albus]